MRRLELSPDRFSTTPLHRQLYHRVRDAIAGGRLKPGDRVPSIRSLASELNLSRGTVELAYQTLASEGYLLSRGAAGTVVSPQIIPARVARATASRPGADVAIAEPTPTGPQPFQLGLPALDAVPTRLWQRLMTRRLRAMDVAAQTVDLQMSTDPGDPAQLHRRDGHLGQLCTSVGDPLRQFGFGSREVGTSEA